MCSKTFWTSLNLCSCRQQASSFLDSGIPLIQFPSKFFLAGLVPIKLWATSVSDGSANLFWVQSPLISEIEFFRAVISFSTFCSCWFCLLFVSNSLMSLSGCSLLAHTLHTRSGFAKCHDAFDCVLVEVCALLCKVNSTAAYEANRRFLNLCIGTKHVLHQWCWIGSISGAMFKFSFGWVTQSERLDNRPVSMLRVAQWIPELTCPSLDWHLLPACVFFCPGAFHCCFVFSFFLFWRFTRIWGGR